MDAQDEEKNPFLLWVKMRWPDRGTMKPNTEPCRVGIISAYGVIFFWQSCPTRGSHDRSLMRPVTGEPPPTPLMLCLYRSTASDLAPCARRPSAVIAGFCVPGRGCRSVMFASPRFGSGSLHLTSLIHRGLSGVPYGPGSSLRSVAGTCSSSLLAPCSASRSSLVQALPITSAR